MTTRSRIHKATRAKYAAIPNAIAQSRTLTPAAKAVLVELLSRPDDWTARADQLAYEHLSQRKVYRVLNELIDAGYVTRSAVRGEDGRMKHWRYDVFDEPVDKSRQVDIGTVQADPERKRRAVRARTHFVAGVTHTKTEETTLHKAAVLGISVVQPEPPNDRPAIFKAYEDAFGLMLTPMLVDELKLLAEEYGEAWVVDAMRIAVTSGKRSLGYAKGILRRWQAEGREAQMAKVAAPRGASRVWKEIDV